LQSIDARQPQQVLTWPTGDWKAPRESFAGVQEKDGWVQLPLRRQLSTDYTEARNTAICLNTSGLWSTEVLSGKNKIFQETTETELQVSVVDLLP